MSSKDCMSETINNSLEYRHAGRTWSSTPFNCLEKLEIKKPTLGSGQNAQVSKTWNHLVFTLPKKYLRNSAIAFNEFRQDTEGQAFLKVFAFFIEMVHRMQNSKGNNATSDIAFFWEWVKKDNIVYNKAGSIVYELNADGTMKKDSHGNLIPEMDEYGTVKVRCVDQPALNADGTIKRTSIDDSVHVAIRLHVFSNRNIPSSEIVNELLGEFESKKPHQLKGLLKYESFHRIKTYGDYCAEICDVYRQDHLSTSKMDDISFSKSSHPANPMNVFSFDTSFNIENGDPIQNNKDNYFDQSMYTFPFMDRVYRISPNDMNLDVIMVKYLPDYYFLRVHPPEVKIFQESLENIRFYVTPHLSRNRYEGMLNERCVALQNNTWQAETMDILDEIVKEMEGDFCVFSVPTNVDLPTYNATGTGTLSWCRFVKSSSADRYQNKNTNL